MTTSPHGLCRALSKQLPPLPPDTEAGDDHHQRQYELACDEHAIELPLRHGNPAILLCFETNRNQIFIGWMPVDGIQHRVTIAIYRYESVRDPFCTPDYYRTAL